MTRMPFQHPLTPIIDVTRMQVDLYSKQDYIEPKRYGQGRELNDLSMTKNNAGDSKKPAQTGPNINYQRDMWDLDSDMEKEEDDNDDSDDGPVLVPV